MMKKIIILILLIFTFSINLEVNAESTVAKEGMEGFNELKSEYEKGPSKFNISENDTITLYGYSSCDSTGCNYKYSNKTKDFKEVLKSSVVCSGGEKNITYQIAGGADGYKENNTAEYIGEAYWSEDFLITCVENSTGASTITLSNDVEPNTTTTTTTTIINNNSQDSDYNSSNTTNNPEQGIETYYIILGIVGILAYVIMTVVKKYNLFKNV